MKIKIPISEPVAAVLKTGGYIPFGDHFIPPDVSWNDFSYYRGKLNLLIARYGGQQSPGPAKLTMELGWDEDPKR